MSETRFTKGPWRADTAFAEAAKGVQPSVSAPGKGSIALVRRKSGISLAEAVANAHLIGAAPDYHVACGGDLHPGEAATCGPLAWLSCAIETLLVPEVKAADQSRTCDPDPDAYDEMVREVEALHRALTAALTKARGES